MNADDFAAPASRDAPPPFEPSTIDPPVARHAAISLRWLIIPLTLVIVALASLQWAPARVAFPPLLAAARQGGLLPVLLASLSLAYAGLAGTAIMLWARARAAAAPRPNDQPPRRRWSRLARRMVPPSGDPTLIGAAARLPQAFVVATLALAAAGTAWFMPAAAAMPPEPHSLFVLGGAAIVLAFPLLIAERLLAATPQARLPEAPSLRALMLLPVLVWPAAGLLCIAGGLGLPYTEQAWRILSVPLIAVGLELALRALGRCFLPPPEPDAAHAASESLLARMLADGINAKSFAAPIRQHLGLDFSRGWAVAFLWAATPPVVLALLLLCWGLTGIIPVGVGQRAIYERFGAPVAVLHPGLHAILPWPMGKARLLEYGEVHETALSGPATPVTMVGAEALPPADADRLWDQPHPGEIEFLIASDTAGQQSFQVVSADIKLRYRIGLSDDAALLAAYRVADPAALLRAVASRAMAGFFAGQTLDAVLGENRETLADAMRATLQKQLDSIDPGIELDAVVIEAIHPPAGAAEAYHAVQAAQIDSLTAVSTARGKAVAARAGAEQHATDLTNQAKAMGAEVTAASSADLIRFTADHAAALADGDSFLLERRLSALTHSLVGKTLTIVDHRIPAAEAPVLDLRPLSPTTARAVGPNQE